MKALNKALEGKSFIKAQSIVFLHAQSGKVPITSSPRIHKSRRVAGKFGGTKVLTGTADRIVVHAAGVARRLAAYERCARQAAEAKARKDAARAERRLTQQVQ